MNVTADGQRLGGEAVGLQYADEPLEVPIWKRALDVGLLVLAAPIIVPVMVVIAGIIKGVSQGPVLFVQERVGLGGRPFRCFKFRTMRRGCDHRLHREHLRELMASGVPMTKMDAHDPRLIPLGRILRGSGLDELPQIFNVALGEMSLVGPRPCMPYEYEHYQDWQRERFTALPGVTGLWQVSGKNRTTFLEMVRLDIHYARQCSLSLDLKILARTIPVLLSQLGEVAVSKVPIKHRPKES